MTEIPERAIIDAAERICAGAFGGNVTLGQPQNVRDWDGRSWTRRFDVRAGQAGAPASVIAKHFLLGEGHGLDEWAGLQLVNSYEGGPSPVPWLYGGDAAQALIVMEDLGNVRQNGLSAILLGDDGVQAAEALETFMISLARIHIAGIGRAAEYDRIHETLPQRTGRDFHSIYQLQPLLQQFASHVQTAGFAVPAEVETELAAVAHALREPGAFLGFTHGDVCPSNVVRQGGQMRLYDLEVSGYRHILLDGAYPQLRYLCCQEAGRIPATVQSRMSSAYRAELSNHWPAVNDKAVYGRHLAYACATWLVVLMARLPRVVEQDRQRVIGTDRQRILQGLRDFGALTMGRDHMPALHDLAPALGDHLQTLWPVEDHQLAPFAVFQSDTA